MYGPNSDEFFILNLYYIYLRTLVCIVQEKIILKWLYNYALKGSQVDEGTSKRHIKQFSQT